MGWAGSGRTVDATRRGLCAGAALRWTGWSSSPGVREGRCVGPAGQAGLSWRWGQDIRERQSFWDRREPEPSGPEGSSRGRGAHLNGRAARAGGDQAGRGQVAMSAQVTVDGLKRHLCLSVEVIGEGRPPCLRCTMGTWTRAPVPVVVRMPRGRWCSETRGPRGLEGREGQGSHGHTSAWMFTRRTRA